MEPGESNRKERSGFYQSSNKCTDRSSAVILETRGLGTGNVREG